MTRRRRPTPTALWLAGALALATPLYGEPRPGSVTGLDLSSPESAAASFVAAWADRDYFVAYLALDPEMRIRFREALYRFDFASILGSPIPDGFYDRFAANPSESAPPGAAPGMTVDAFADFEGLFRAAGAPRSATLQFGSIATGELVAVPAGGAAAPLARVVIPPSAGGGVFVLRRSPEGRWRLLGIEKRALPEFWEYQPDQR